MGTPLGPKYIPYTYMDPLGWCLAGNGGKRFGMSKVFMGTTIGNPLLDIPTPLYQHPSASLNLNP